MTNKIDDNECYVNEIDYASVTPCEAGVDFLHENETIVRPKFARLFQPESTFLDKIVKFGTDFFAAGMKQDDIYVPTTLFDGYGCRILAMITKACMENESILKSFVSSASISKQLNGKICRSTVMKRLKQYAEWGFITVDTHLWRRSSYADIPIRESSCITLNEGFLVIIRGAQASLRRDFINTMLTQGQYRVDRGEEEGMNLQGFSMLVKFGMPENQQNKISDIVMSANLESSIEDIKSEKEQKAEIDKTWRKHEENFIRQAAIVWVDSQEDQGFGREQPMWAGDMTNMTAAAKRERSELVKTLREYGGAVACVTWALFCGFRPTVDKNGKNVFDPAKPHSQCVFTDKRPTQYAKNFTTLLKDSEFRTAITTNWYDNSQVLTGIFGELISLEPKNGSHYDKLGYRVGDRHVLSHET